MVTGCHKTDETPKILIVDDKSFTREILTRMISLSGYLSFAASSVSEAISFLDSNEIDLVITDYRMPGENGFELLTHIKKNFPAIKSVLMSACPTDELTENAMKAGAIDFMPEPFTVNELDLLLKRLSVP